MTPKTFDNPVVVLDRQGRLPPVDGSQLINLPLSRDIDSYKEEIIQRLLQSEEEIREKVLAEINNQPKAVLPERAEPEFVEVELTLEEIKEEATYTINALCEHTRQEHLGVGPAQMMVYAEKFEEASDYIVDGAPSDVTPYPFLKAETEATGKDAEIVANDIIDKRGEWIAFNTKVERIRMVAKTHINEAQTAETVDNVVEIAAKHLDKLIF